jgi:predicted secreted hydrolase
LLFFTNAPAQEYRDITPDYDVALPRDLYYRPDYRVQWWYFTGHLYDQTGREFGYELTFFVVGVQKRQYRSRFGVRSLHISHFAVSDVENQQFHYFDQTDSGVFGFSGADTDRLNVWVNKNRLTGSADRMQILASRDDTSIDLVLRPLKPLVLHGQSGYSRKSEESPLHASIYLSYTDLETSGTITVGGARFDVRGRSWFDREISSKALEKDITGWDWFALKLDDRREIMLYLLRKKDGSLDRSSSGTIVYQDGTTRHIPVQDFSVSVLRHYRSKKTKSRYPSRWSIAIPSEGLMLTVTPLIEDQEFVARHSTLNYYWEGTCGVEGTRTGRAYVELTGY